MPEQVKLASRHAIILEGYLENIDSLPDDAKQHGLTEKVSVIFNTYYPEFKGGFFFDHELILSVCNALTAAFDPCVEHEGDRITLSELEDLWRTQWLKDDKDDPSNNDLFERMTITESEQLRYMDLSRFISASISRLTRFSFEFDGRYTSYC